MSYSDRLKNIRIIKWKNRKSMMSLHSCFQAMRHSQRHRKPKELDLISRYLQLISVSLRQIPKTSRKVAFCVPNLFPYLLHNLWLLFFQIANYHVSQWRIRLIPQFRVLRVSSDMTGHTKAGSNPGQARNKNHFFPLKE